MPTYDYVCNACSQRFDVFLTYSEYGHKQVRCIHCGSPDVKRRPPRVRMLKSDESRMEGMAGDFSNLEGLEQDPRALGKVMRKMGREMGEDLPPEFNEAVDRLEAGQSPNEIEAALPDLDSGADDDDL